jgi:DNA helicase IV
MSSDQELQSERSYLSSIRAAHKDHVQRAQESARLLGLEAADAAAEGIRDIIDEDSEADTAVRAAQVRQTAIRAMHAANRVRELEGQGTALAFGRFSADSGCHQYVGRLSVFDGDETLLVDWRAPAAVPFYRATPLERHGVRTRRQFHYGEGGADALLESYSDDVLDIEALTTESSLRGEAAVLAAVNTPTQGQMKSVVALIQSEQDAIIRAPSNTPLIVQGGPGTGKTVVALHRAAYLLYDQREELSDRGVLIVGPTRRFLRYVSNVLPSLGETGVLSAIPAELFPALRGRSESRVLTNLKGRAEMVILLRRAVRDRQRRPREGLRLFYGSRRVALSVSSCQRIFDRATRAVTHNDGAEQFRNGLIDALVDEVYDPSFFSVEEATESFVRHDEVRRYLLSHWPTLTPEQCLNDLLGSPALLRSAGRAAGITGGEMGLLARERSRERDLDRRRWADGDMPLLDELESLLGQRATELTPSYRRRERDMEDEFELAEALDEAESTMGADGTIVRGQPVGGTLDLDEPTVPLATDYEPIDPSGADEPMIDPGTLVDRFQGDRASMVGDVDPGELTPDVVDDIDLGGVTVVELATGERSFRFGHVIVDEAQELSAMQWRMIVRRAEPGCITAVGDLAQRTISPTQKWDDIVPDLGPMNEMRLTINYRSPAEVLRPAAAVLERYAPELAMPRALRTSLIPTELVLIGEDPLSETILRVLKARPGAERRTVACIYHESSGERVEAASAIAAEQASAAGYELIAVRSSECRGLEFDASLIIEPELFGTDPGGLASLFVALTRSTQWSAVLTAEPNQELIRSVFP